MGSPEWGYRRSRAGTVSLDSVFDEIDRGVGGAVASAIGERLARLSSDGQLLAVTHSPQVAARGRMHYMIAKSSDGTVTKTGVALLDEGVDEDDALGSLLEQLYRFELGLAERRGVRGERRQRGVGAEDRSPV